MEGTVITVGVTLLLALLAFTLVLGKALSRLESLDKDLTKFADRMNAINRLEATQAAHETRLDHHDKRLNRIERGSSPHFGEET